MYECLSQYITLSALSWIRSSRLESLAWQKCHIRWQLDEVNGCFSIVDWAIKIVDFVIFGFAPVVKIVYLFLDRLHWLQNGIVFVADQLLWWFNWVQTLWQISYQAGYLFNFSLQFVSDFFLDVGKEFCLPDLSNFVNSERFWEGSHFFGRAQKSRCHCLPHTKPESNTTL